jgi:glycine oxidase
MRVVTGSRDILVVGAGIVGCAVAYEVARRGASVSLVDDRPAGFGATQASAGMLAPFTEAAGGGPLLDLGARSLDMYDAFVTRVREDSGMTIPYERTGSLHVARVEESLAHFATTHQVLAGRGVASDLLSPNDLRAREPHLGADVFGGLLIPSQGHVGAFDLTRALAAAAQHHCARIVNDTPVRRVRAIDGGVAVDTDGGTLRADFAVLAAGAWTGQIEVDGASARVPVRPVRGQIVHLGWSGTPLRRITWDERCYVVPRVDGTLLVGATVEDAGFDERTTVAGVRDLLEAACDLLPHAWTASLLAVKVGLRPGSPDALPAIGWSRAVPGLIYATGHYRNGVLLAPLTAALVAGALTGDAPDAALAWTSPDRFGEL